MCKEMTIGQGGRRIDVGMGTKKDEWGSSASLCLMSMSVTAKHNPMDESDDTNDTSIWFFAGTWFFLMM